MAEKMTRRTFLKGAAAAAAAVSLSGMLAGCGADNGYDVGEFRIYFNGNPVYGWLDSEGHGFVQFNIGLKGVQNGITFNKKYSEIFAAQVNEQQKFALQNGETGIMWQGSTTKCSPYFVIEDKDVYTALCNGEQPLQLTVTLSTVSRTFVFDLKNRTMTAQ